MSEHLDLVHVWGVHAVGTRWEYSDLARARDRYLNEVVVATEKGWHDKITLYRAVRTGEDLEDHEVDDGAWILQTDPMVETVRTTVETPTL